MDLPERYIFWNYVLAEHCLLSDSIDGQVLLTVTPRILSAALESAGEPYRSAQEAESDFKDAAGAAYRSAVLSSRDGLKALASCADGEPPYSLSYLALSVLAAYHMRTDEDRTGRAYYPRFAELLGCGLAGTYPVGFDGDDFIALWSHLAWWLERNHQRQLALPTSSGVRRFLPYPFAHVPLRQVDIERLPQFFDAHGYEPGARAPLDRLAYDLYEGAGPWRQFTEVGQRALADPERRRFVVRQAAYELDQWDGCRTDSSGRRIATIELWVDVRRRRAYLFLLARRPRGFPEVFEDGGLVFESSQDGWYEPVLLGPDDGRLLREGLWLTTRSAGRSYALHLRPSSVVPLTPSEEFSGLVSNHFLRRDARCAVLCPENLADSVAGHVEAIGRQPVRPRFDDTLPRRWCLFLEVCPREAREPPPEMGLLRVESSVALIPEGGLRLGRRWTWLEGAPATLRVVGAHTGLEVRVDGKAAEVDEEGLIRTDALRAQGRHVIEVDNQLRQRITVLLATVHPDVTPWRSATEADRPPHGLVAVPRGRWTLIGNLPGQRRAIDAPDEGAAVDPGFSVVWAVSVGSGPGSAAIHFHRRDTDSALAERAPSADVISRADTLLWAEVVYQTAIRRPLLSCASSKCTAPEIRRHWLRLVASARSLKRRIRRGRR